MTKKPRFIDTLYSVGTLQKQHWLGAEWLRNVPEQSAAVKQFREDCEVIARNSHASRLPVFEMLWGAARHDRPFSWGDGTIGILREALNEADRKRRFSNGTTTTKATTWQRPHDRLDEARH